MRSSFTRRAEGYLSTTTMLNAGLFAKSISSDLISYGWKLHCGRFYGRSGTVYAPLGNWPEQPLGVEPAKCRAVPRTPFMGCRSFGWSGTARPDRTAYRYGDLTPSGTPIVSALKRPARESLSERASKRPQSISTDSQREEHYQAISLVETNSLDGP
jgi:hypothetical protein